MTSCTGVRAGEGAPTGVLSLRAPAPGYRAHVFDCDGVILDTAHAKTDAFRRVASRYGEEYGVLMAEYHRGAGSIGRRARWEHFFARVLGLEPQPGEVDECVALTGALVMQATLAAPPIPGVTDYLADLASQRVSRHLVSGIADDELHEIVAHHRLAGHFYRVRGGDKHRILRAMVEEGDIPLPAVYYGDTPDDLRAAHGAHMDFVAVLGASEFTATDFPAGTPTIVDFRAAVLA